MTNLVAAPGWDPVPQLETYTPALGGPGGPMNSQAQALLNRQERMLADLTARLYRRSVDPADPQWGAVPGAITDQSTALQASLNDLHAMGGGVWCPTPGVYKCLNPLTSYEDIHIQAFGVTLDFSGQSSYMTSVDRGLLVVRGTATSQVNFAADALAGAMSFSATSVADIAPGDLIEMSLPTANINNWSDTSVGVFTGQLNYVVDIIGTTVFIDSVIYDDMLLSDGARFRKVNPLRNVVIEGLTMIGKGRDVSTVGDVGISLFFCENPRVSDCRFVGVDQRSLNFISCVNFEANHNQFKFNAKGTNASVNYGITYSCSRNGDIHHNVAANMRHGIVSSHLSGSLTNKYYGISRNIRIHHNHISNSWHGGIATHSDAEHVFVDDNILSSCAFGVNLRDRNASASRNFFENGTGASLLLSVKPRKQYFSKNRFLNCDVILSQSSIEAGHKMTDITVDGCYIEGGTGQIVFTPDATSGANTNINVINTVASNVTGPGGSSAMIRFNGNIRGTIRGNILYNCANISGVSLASTAKARVIDNELTNIGLTAFNMGNATGSYLGGNFYAGYATGITAVTGVTIGSNADGGAAAVT